MQTARAVCMHKSKMKALTIFSLAVAATLVGCKDPAPDQGKIAGQTAKIYYEYLINGKYEAYVDGFHQPDSIPANYREQLITNAKMFVGMINEKHNGLKSVSVANAKADTARHVGQAFLLLCFGDSTREEIVVPMEQHHGVWMMR